MVLALFQQCHCTVVVNSDCFKGETSSALVLKTCNSCQLLLCNKHSYVAALALSFQGHFSTVCESADEVPDVSEASMTCSVVARVGSTCVGAFQRPTKHRPCRHFLKCLLRSVPPSMSRLQCNSRAECPQAGFLFFAALPVHSLLSSPSESDVLEASVAKPAWREQLAIVMPLVAHRDVAST